MLYNSDSLDKSEPDKGVLCTCIYMMKGSLQQAKDNVELSFSANCVNPVISAIKDWKDMVRWQNVYVYKINSFTQHYHPCLNEDYTKSFYDLFTKVNLDLLAKMCMKPVIIQQHHAHTIYGYIIQT